MEISQILGWTATFLFSIMVFPQMYKTVKSKDTSGVSLTLFVIYLIANVIALVYAFLIYQTPLIIKYSIAIVSTIIYLCIFWYYFKMKNVVGKKEFFDNKEETFESNS